MKEKEIHNESEGSTTVPGRLFLGNAVPVRGHKVSDAARTMTVNIVCKPQEQDVQKCTDDGIPPTYGPPGPRLSEVAMPGAWCSLEAAARSLDLQVEELKFENKRAGPTRLRPRGL